MDLLSKTRRINSLLQNSTGKQAYFKEISNTLSDVLDADTFIASNHGELLGFSIKQSVNNDYLKNMLEQRQLPGEYAQKLLEVSETSSNYDVNHEHITFPAEDKIFKQPVTTIIPIVGGGERLGTLLLRKYDKGLQGEELILGEYGSAAVGFEMLRKKTEKRAEKARNKAIIKMAVKSLSYSELEAVEYIFNELTGNKGLLVASKIADRHGITRSVIVNALRKLEGAGIVESRSLGMKGTYIKVLNKEFLTVLDEMKVK